NHVDTHSFPTRRSSDLAVEISHLYLNIMTNAIGLKLCSAFAQTSPSEEVRNFMLRGKDVSQKHINILRILLCKAILKRRSYLMRSEEHTSELQSRFDLV